MCDGVLLFRSDAACSYFRVKSSVFKILRSCLTSYFVVDCIFIVNCMILMSLCTRIAVNLCIASASLPSPLRYGLSSFPGVCSLPSVYMCYQSLLSIILRLGLFRFLLSFLCHSEPNHICFPSRSHLAPVTHLPYVSSTISFDDSYLLLPHSLHSLSLD